MVNQTKPKQFQWQGITRYVKTKFINYQGTFFISFLNQNSKLKVSNMYEGVFRVNDRVQMCLLWSKIEANLYTMGPNCPESNLNQPGC